VYDKFSRVLRVETTVNDLSFFKPALLQAEFFA